jgi:hypothetical protein
MWAWFSTRPTLTERLFDAISAELEARVTEVSVPATQVGTVTITLDVRRLIDVSAADIVSAVQATQGELPRNRPREAGSGVRIRALGEMGSDGPAPEIRVSWQPNNPAQAYRLEGWQGSWTEAFCELSTLEEFETPGPLSDFSRIGDCHPQLRWITICSAEDAVGLEGLAALNPPGGVAILAPVRRIESLASLRGLDKVAVSLVGDSVENRSAAMAQLPNTEIAFPSPGQEEADRELLSAQCR